MGYWEGKLAGFLHDPLDKVFRSDHEEVAGEAASSLLKGAKVNVDIISGEVKQHHKAGILRVPDRAASAANRTLVPSGDDVMEVVLQNPFSGILIKPSLPAPFSIKEKPSFDPVAEGADGRGAMLRVAHSLVRIYHDLHLKNGGVARCVLLLPEDTRVPSSPMVSHLQMVSALTGVESVGQLGFYLVYMDIGGVQDFISVSRKTVDFWASSYIFSLLSLSAIKAVVDWLGPQQLILPWHLYSPLIEGCIFGVERDWEELVAPTVPNSAYLIIRGSPEGDVSEETIKKRMYGAMVGFWNELCGMLVEKLAKYVGSEELMERVRGQVRRQMSFFSLFKRVRVAVLKYPDDVNGDGQLCDVYNKLRAKGMFEELADLKNVLSGLSSGYESFMLEDFEAVNGAVGAVMSSEKGRELFASEKVPEGAEKCSLCGVRDALELGDAWGKMKDSIVDAGERLCAPCLLKRLFRDVLPDALEVLGVKTRGGVLKYDVPSLGDVATAWFRASLLALLLASLEMGVEERGAVQSALGNLSKYLDKAKKILGEHEVQLGGVPLIALGDRDVLVFNRLVYSLFTELKELGDETVRRLALDILYSDSVLLIFDELASSLSRGLGDSAKAMNVLKEEKLYESYREAMNGLRELGGKFGGLVRRASEKLFEHVCRLFDLSEGEATRELVKAVLRPTQPELSFIRKGKQLPLPISFAPQTRFALLRMDGDDVGKWISGELLPPWQVLIAPTNEDSVLGNREKAEEKSGKTYGDVYARPRPVAPSTMSTLSMVITLNVKVIRSVVEAFGGFLVYTGGDDVLALLPAEVWHYVYLLLRFLYSREVMDSLDANDGRMYVYGMGARATASFAVVVAHYKAYLKNVIKESYEVLERRSKGLKDHKRTVKDGLSVVLMSRSAPIQHVYALPNVLVKSGEELKPLRVYDYEKVRETRERIMNRKKVVDEWMRAFGSLLCVVSGSGVEDYASGGGVSGRSFNFIGLLPGQGGLLSGEGRVYSPLSDAAALCALVKSGTVSSRAFHDVHEFCMVQREGKGVFYNVRVERGKVEEAKEPLIVLLRSVFRHKVEGGGEDKGDVVEALIRVVKKMMDQMLPLVVNGYPYPLIEANTFSKITRKDMELIASNLGLLQTPTGREVLYEWI